jgi:urease accessory protein UreF
MGGRGSGRRYTPTEKDRGRVEALAGYGFTEEQIAADLGIGAETLRKYYRTELTTAHIKANALVAQSLFRKATGDGNGAVAAAIFWMKTRCGWREVERDMAPLLGKKQMQEAAALTAGHGSDWADDLDYAGDGGKPN